MSKRRQFGSVLGVVLPAALAGIGGAGIAAAEGHMHAPKTHAVAATPAASAVKAEAKQRVQVNPVNIKHLVSVTPVNQKAAKVSVTPVNNRVAPVRVDPINKKQPRTRVNFNM